MSKLTEAFKTSIRARADAHIAELNRRIAAWNAAPPDEREGYPHYVFLPVTDLRDLLLEIADAGMTITTEQPSPGPGLDAQVSYALALRETIDECLEQ